MNEWPNARLADVAEIRFSNVDKKTDVAESPVRLCNYMDVYGNSGYITAGLPFMEASASRAEIERFGVANGDVIVTKDSETPDDIGVPAVVVDDIPNLVCGYHLALIKPNRAQVDPIYLAKQLGSKATASYFSKLANGSTRYGLSSSSIASTRISLAPLPQQRRIAEILTTLDETIEQTEALIAKYQQIKAGLMHDLFTRGVTPDGRLRPTRDQAPHLYKESPLGWIPKEWGFPKLSSLYSEPSKNGLYKPVAHYGYGAPMVHMPQMFRSVVVDLSDAVRVQVNASELVRFGLTKGDLLFARRSLTLEGAGRCSLVPELEEPTTFESSIIRVRLDQGIVLPACVNYFLSSANAYRFRLRIIRQVAVSGVAAPDLATLPIPLPSLDEQHTILERLMTSDRQIEAEQVNAFKFSMFKHGLMHDLLTGRVRVKVAEAAA